MPPRARRRHRRYARSEHRILRHSRPEEPGTSVMRLRNGATGPALNPCGEARLCDGRCGGDGDVNPANRGVRGTRAHNRPDIPRTTSRRHGRPACRALARDSRRPSRDPGADGRRHGRRRGRSIRTGSGNRLRHPNRRTQACGPWRRWPRRSCRISRSSACNREYRARHEPARTAAAAISASRGQRHARKVRRHPALPAPAHMLALHIPDRAARRWIAGQTTAKSRKRREVSLRSDVAPGPLSPIVRHGLARGPCRPMSRFPPPSRPG